MARPRKLIFNQTVLMVTTSVEEGLLLTANPLMVAIILGILARAQTLHPVRICRLMVEATHVHLIMVVDNPDDVRGFMERFKTESAHAINRLLGRGKRTVWCEGYDSPVLLTPGDTAEKIAYIESNPAKDNLVEKAVDFPGISNLNINASGSYAWIRRSMIEKLPSRSLTINDYEVLRDELIAKATKFHTFSIEKDAWMECFGISDPKEHQFWNERISNRIKEKEDEFKAARSKSGQKVFGRVALMAQAIKPTYVPERSGRRMWCICSDLELRKVFLGGIKRLIDLAKETYQKWRRGDFTMKFPLGLYPPSMPKHAELLKSGIIYC